MAADPQTIHATSVSIASKAVVIIGPSGSGKSALALDLLALGAGLIADDYTVLTREGAIVVASCPATISGQIEARGVGILGAQPAPPTAVALVVDLGVAETDRLPPWRTTQLLDVTLPLLHRIESSHFPAAIIRYIEDGRAH